MYAFMHACMHACVRRVYMSVCTHACVCVRVCVFMLVSMHVCSSRRAKFTCFGVVKTSQNSITENRFSSMKMVAVFPGSIRMIAGSMNEQFVDKHI